MALQERFHRDSTGSSAPKPSPASAQVDEPSGPATPAKPLLGCSGYRLDHDGPLSMTVGYIAWPGNNPWPAVVVISFPLDDVAGRTRWVTRVVSGWGPTSSTRLLEHGGHLHLDRLTGVCVQPDGGTQLPHRDVHLRSDALPIGRRVLRIWVFSRRRAAPTCRRHW